MWWIKIWQTFVRLVMAAVLLGCGPSGTKVSSSDAARIKEAGKKIVEESQKKQAEQISKALKRHGKDTAAKLAQKLSESQTDDDDR